MLSAIINILRRIKEKIDELRAHIYLAWNSCFNIFSNISDYLSSSVCVLQWIASD